MFGCDQKLIGSHLLIWGEPLDVVPWLEDIGFIASAPPLGEERLAAQNQANKVIELSQFILTQPKSKRGRAKAARAFRESRSDSLTRHQAEALNRQIKAIEEKRLTIATEVFSLARHGGLIVCSSHEAQRWHDSLKAALAFERDGEFVAYDLDPIKSGYKEALIAAIDQNCPRLEDGVILDPFMGQGDIALAALALGHRFIGIESDFEAFQIACHRLENAQTGEVVVAYPFEGASPDFDPHGRFEYA